MLPAKLFAVAAGIFLLCAGLGTLIPSRAGIDIYVHDTYFVSDPMLIFLFCAFMGLNFAVLYYAAVRFYQAHWNRVLSFLHFALFLCFGVSFSVVFVLTAIVRNGAEIAKAVIWLVIPLILGTLSLLLCFATFTVNLTLTVVQVLRARFASR